VLLARQVQGLVGVADYECEGRVLHIIIMS
jgi:hypothetical protein